MSGVILKPNTLPEPTGIKKNTSCALCRKTWGNEVKFYRVPSKLVIRQRWEAICGKQFGPSAKICEKHFVLTDFKENEGGKRRRLKSDTVPSLLLPPLTRHKPYNSNLVVAEPGKTLPTTQDCCTQANEQSIIGARASVMVYDDNQKKWVTSEYSSGLNKVQIYHYQQNNAVRVVGRKLQDNEVFSGRVANNPVGHISGKFTPSAQTPTPQPFQINIPQGPLTPPQGHDRTSRLVEKCIDVILDSVGESVNSCKYWK